MYTTNMTREVTIKDLWNIFSKRFLLMVLAAVIAIGGSFVISTALIKPRYTSTATLYILSQDDRESLSYTSESFSLALKVVSDCDYLLKSHAVLDQVIDDLQLDLTYEDLYDCITTTNPENTRILEVTAEGRSPTEAKEIVDALCSIGPSKIRDAMGFDQVNLYEYGILNYEASNDLGMMAYLLIGFTAAVFVYAAYLLAYLLDDRIRTEEDIQKYLGLSVLGVIPNANEAGKKSYNYGYGYGRNPYKKKTRGSSAKSAPVSTDPGKEAET